MKRMRGMIDINSLMSNQIMTGMSVAAIISWALYQLKAFPFWVIRTVKRYTTVNLTIFNDNHQWWIINRHIADCQKINKTRTLSLDDYFKLIPGLGNHLLWVGASPLFLCRSRIDSKSNGGPTEQLDITVIGRTPITIEQLIERIKLSQKEVPKQEIFVRDQHWVRMQNKQLKDFESVILTGGLKEDIVNDYEKFNNKESEYHRKGIPYKRCYLFTGPPGTGKTSMILALAAKVKRELFILNLKDITSDAKLIDAVNETPKKRAIILIEDIDRNKVVLKQEFQDELPPEVSGGLREGVISLSGLLNILDGVACPEGTIYIITTNHPEKLVPALTRPGRVDRVVNFNLFGTKEQVKFLQRFYDTEDTISEDKLPDAIVPAELQTIVLANNLENSLLILQGKKHD
jgi:chaperone BCS1